MDYLHKLKHDTWLPFLMPYWWRWIIGVGLVIGIGIGWYIWDYTLALRGL